MICQFTFKGNNVYIKTESIVAIMPEVKGSKAVIFTEPPLDTLTVDESVDEAFAEWYTRLMEQKLGDDTDLVHWSQATIEV